MGAAWGELFHDGFPPPGEGERSRRGWDEDEAMSWHRLFLVVALLSLALGCGGGGDSSLTAQAAPLTPPLNLDAAALRAQLTSLYQESDARAMLATVRVGEQEVLSLAIGDSMTNVPATLQDHIRIGGVSETYWGVIVMLLVEQGVFTLDDKIAKWLPDLLAADQVTVGMLLNNLGGYKDYVLTDQFTADDLANPFRAYSRDEIIDYAVADGELNFPPGTASRYSHTEFTIMGKLIEKATGKTMEQLHQELIFDPLGLTQTGYMTTAALPEPVLHAFTSYRGVYEDATYFSPSWVGDSGPLYSTIDEVARWARIHGRGQMLTPESFARLTARPTVAQGSKGYLACGFVVTNGWFVQNPSFNGYSGAYGYLPEQDVTIVIYTTQSTNPKSDAQAFAIFKKLVTTITPSRPILF
jgi:CubicO group peptidase (beta-lactamase class C family)